MSVSASARGDSMQEGGSEETGPRSPDEPGQRAGPRWADGESTEGKPSLKGTGGLPLKEEITKAT